MDARSLLNSTSSISPHRYGHTFTSMFNVPISSVGVRSSDTPNRVGHGSYHLRFSRSFEFRASKPGKAHRNFAFNINHDAAGTSSNMQAEKQIKGEVILQKASLFTVTDYSATLADDVSDFLGSKVSLQLISSDQVDPDTGRGKRSEVSYLDWNPWDGPIAGDKCYKISFKWNTSLGEPGAFLVKNKHPRVFFLKSLTLKIPGKGQMRFQCNSWISPEHMDNSDRVFFVNKSYLPDATPEGLKTLRKQDLVQLRGNGTGERKDSDRIYDYDLYNDLGDPDKDPKLKRVVIGGSEEFPYPRRCRTGRPPTKSDPASESPSTSSSLFVPLDERFPHSNYSDLVSHTLLALMSSIIPRIRSMFSSEFKSLEDINNIYVRGFPSPYNSPNSISKIFKSPFQFVHELLDKAEDSPLINFPRPQVFDANESAWRTDEEFARQTLSGLSPMVIRRLEKFPPSSSLNAEEYGPQQSSITAEHTEKYLEGLSVAKATESKRLFVLDYHDMYIPYTARINEKSVVKTYASRTLFFLTNQGILKPVAIELSLAATAERQPERHVYTPAEEGSEEGALWLLAKTHVRINEAGYHQVIGHWLLTHAVMEPIIIASNRQLNTMHPLYKLLKPHFLNTMDANQVARKSALNAEGSVELIFSSSVYSMQMSSKAYKNWRFNEQALPADLLNRGMAVPDPTAPHGLRLVVEDYPFAVDGLEIWAALKQWVTDYLSLYYKSDEAIKSDTELQSWWNEIVNVGHADIKEGWYKMENLDEMTEAVTTILWLASALHANVNFGLYVYGGYMPNRPTLCRALIPQKGSPEYAELAKDPEAYLLKTVSDPKTTLTTMSSFEVISSHAKNEVYVGQREGSTPDWNDDVLVEQAFDRFSAALLEVEKNVIERNKNPALRNRLGPAKVPYTLLYPSTSDLTRTGGLTGRGIPNSVCQ